MGCFVLILVVMDDALVRTETVFDHNTVIVLILVVMDDALVLVFISLFSVTAIMS